MLGLYPIAALPLAADPNDASVGFSTNALALIDLDALSDTDSDFLALHDIESDLTGVHAPGQPVTTFGFAMIQNFTMVSGDTRTLTVRVRDPDDAVVAITGATIRWRAARSYGKTANITKATGGSGITITDGPNGVFVVTLDPADTASLYGTFYHEAEVTFSDDTVSTVLRGTMKVNQDLIVAT